MTWKELCQTLYEANIALIPKSDRDIKQQQNYKTIPLMNIDAKIFSKILANSI
jgi:hypothetical protein